jgi:vacuolar protein sorting-associated protein 54
MAFSLEFFAATNVNRLQRDAEHFQSKLSKIDGFGDLGERLLELVRQKNIAATEAAPAEADSKGPAETSDSTAA